MVASPRSDGSGESTDAASAVAEKLEAEFRDALFNDLNTPLALAVMWRAAGEKTLFAQQRLALLETFDQVFGLGIAEWQKEDEVEIPAAIQALLEQREAARREKTGRKPDRLRDEILNSGCVTASSHRQ